MNRRKIFDISYYRKYQSNESTINDVLNLILLNVPTVGISRPILDAINYHLFEILVRKEWLGGSTHTVRVHSNSMNMMHLSPFDRAIAYLGSINTRDVQIMIDDKQCVVVVIAGTTVYIGFDRFINDVFAGRTDILVDLLDSLGIDHDDIECGYEMPYNNEQKCKSGFYRIDGLDQTVTRFLLIDRLLDTIHDALDDLAKNKVRSRYNSMKFNLTVVNEPDECVKVFRNAVHQYIAYREKKRREIERPMTASGWIYQKPEKVKRILMPCKNKLYYFYTRSMKANQHSKEMLFNDACDEVEKIIKETKCREYELPNKSRIFHVDKLVPIFSEIALWNKCVLDNKGDHTNLQLVNTHGVLMLFKNKVDFIGKQYIDTAILAYMHENEPIIYNELIRLIALRHNKYRKRIETGEFSYKECVEQYTHAIEKYLEEKRKRRAEAEAEARRYRFLQNNDKISYFDRPVMLPSNKETSWQIKNALRESFEYDDPELAYRYMSMKDLFPETEQ